MIPLLSPEALPSPAQSLLFSPLTLGPVTVPNRVWLPAMVTWLSNDEGEVTDDVLLRYERYARGEPGMIVLEAMGVRDVRSGPLLRISHDRYLPGLTRLAERVHGAGPALVIPQIIDFLKISVRDPVRYLSRLQPKYPQFPNLLERSEEELASILTPRELEELRFGYRQRVEDLSLQEVESLPQHFARAAVRAREAGFDGVELHFAHAYTMASFLSGRNGRRDGYGGSLEARVHLPLEVIRAVQQAVGSDFLVGLRLLGSEDIDGGTTLEEACYFAQAFARAGIHFISVSRGGKFEDARQPKVGQAAYPYTGHSGHMCMPDHTYPEGYNLHLPEGIRQAVHAAGVPVPVVAAGRINTYPLAETILQTGRADLIGMARGLLADPDWPKKVRDGVGQVQFCKYGNVCEALDRNHLPVRCQLWMKKPVGRMHPPDEW